MGNLFAHVGDQAVTALVAFLVTTVGSVLVGLLGRRKHLRWRELYDSPVGLRSPLQSLPGNPAVDQFLHQLKRVTVLVIEVTNTGPGAIGDADYDQPVRLRFPTRYILDYRVSDAEPDALKTQVVADSFVSAIPSSNGDREEPTDGVFRERLRRDLRAQLGDATTSSSTTAGRQQLNLVLRTPLRRGEGFKLLVDLKETTDGPADAVTDEKHVVGDHVLRSGGTFNAESSVTRRRWIGCLVLAALAIASLGAFVGIVVNSRPQLAAYCATGHLDVLGSTAFRSTIERLQGDYMSRCPGASITVDAGGSVKGLRELGDMPLDRKAHTVVVSDGEAAPGAPVDRRSDMAAVLYTMVANADVRVGQLTADQVRGIFTGRYTSWSQLGSPSAAPIVIVSRGAESGTRKVFERYVLGPGQRQVELNSDGCERPDRVVAPPEPPVTRCERDTTSQVLDVTRRTPGAIGYADTPEVSHTSGVTPLLLDGALPRLDYIDQGSYPLWTIEYLYAPSGVAMDGLAQGFATYLNSVDARGAMTTGADASNLLPCRNATGVVERPCQTVR